MGDTVIAGRYRLERQLGKGGMGVVWHARDEILDRPVALKEILMPTGSGRALREAQAAARLASPYIVTVHDVITDQGRSWIVMELVRGPSLAEVLAEGGPLPEARVAVIAGQVLKALAVAHASGVLHRDVKPANILLDEDRVVLTDFGIAAVDGQTTLTASQDLIGSLEYLAPERMLGADASAAADLWALGVTLYQAVEGKSPFQRADLPSSLAAAMTRAPDAPKLAGELWPMLKRLLSRQPADRPTARQALDLLSGPAPGKPAKRRTAKHFAVLCAVVAASASLTVLATWAQPVETPQPQPAAAVTGEFVLQTFDTFKVAVPQGWPRYASGQQVTWNDPAVNADRQIRIGAVVSNTRNAFAYQQERDRELRAQSGYQQLRLVEVQATDGHRAAADLEYSIGLGTSALRVYSRVEVSPWGKLVETRFIASSPQDWQQSERIRETVLESLRLR